MKTTGTDGSRNRLASSTSPYLLQHAGNPVDWYPWGDEALARARGEDKPIFLSVGYSSCHWCHVMERESFENPAIADFLNRHFVSIKVDREERPDIDETYMKAVQAMTGSGGWPMSVFLTPDLEPFYGGTYFPPTDRYGRPGFLSVLNYLATTWRDSRSRAVDSARQLRAHVERMSGVAKVAKTASQGLVDATLDALASYFDSENGGFGGAPKFPHPMDLSFLLRVFARGNDAVRAPIELSLTKMARGGIHDQLGGGFHRYATDERWLVPHFEKMLYDNALLAPVYAEAWVALGDPLYERVARSTCDYVLREMTDRDGGFHSATDADSEGEEGRYFVWTTSEVESLLGKKEARAFAAYFGMTEGGNFEHGANVLEQIGEEGERSKFEGAIARLLEARAKRIPPALDDKVLVEWNGLMIAALARCGALLSNPRWIEAAERAAAFILDRMTRPRDGSFGLLRSYRGGTSHIDAFLSDHANLIHALLELCAVSPNPRWFDSAIALTREVLTRFAAPGGGFFATSDTHEKLMVRSRDPFDNATPSGNSVMATNLLRLSHLLGDASLGDAADATIAGFTAMIEESPAGFGWMMQAVDLLLHEPVSVVIVDGDDAAGATALARAVVAKLRPGVFVLRTDGRRAMDPSAPAPLRERVARGGKATAYVCRGGTCLAPIGEPGELSRVLDTLFAVT